ncbi:MAG: signal peptidase II [Actinomycetaceae bacterium]|nr:signal peptidase II [Actinomycetaceae bacterium]
MTSATVLVATSIFALASDQMTKVWALEHLKVGEIHPFVGSFIQLQLVFNPGAAFSFLAHSTWIFTIVAIVISAGVIYLIPRVHSLPWACALGLLLGGAIGNLIDRLIRPPAFGVGHVVDFLNWNGWFVGNVADIWIVLAAGGLFILAALGIPMSPIAEAASSNRGEDDCGD